MRTEGAFDTGDLSAIADPFLIQGQPLLLLDASAGERRRRWTAAERLRAIRGVLAIGCRLPTAAGDRDGRGAAASGRHAGLRGADVRQTS